MSTTKEYLYQKYETLIVRKKVAAYELNISEATLDRLRKSGAIQSKRVAGGVFFTIDEIASFIDA